jgi:hypothetical protein
MTLQLIQYLLNILFNLIVPKPHHLNAEMVHNVHSEKVVVLPVVMNLVFNLNHQSGLMTVEIGNEKSLRSNQVEEDGMLTQKLLVLEFSVAEMFPE